ncbi:MAG TPA: PspA/IM30 family protein [Acidimicrobiales bacterium]|jgi:phage shock protein A
MLKRWWNYIKTWFGMKSKQAMDPKVEIEAAIAEARKRDQALRTEAAKVIAHRTRVADEMSETAGDVAESKELAKQALMKSDASAKTGNAVDADKWSQAAQAIAMRLSASQKNLDSMQQQLQVADQQAEAAKTAVHDNAMRLEEITAKRMEMLGQLEQAKMQESVNNAMASINSNIGGDAPSLKEIEDKIQDRMADAMAKTELTASTPEGAMAELSREVNLAGAQSTLEDLRSELGLGPAPAIEAAPATAETSGPAAVPAPPAAIPQAPAPQAPPAAPRNGNTTDNTTQSGR